LGRFPSVHFAKRNIHQNNIGMFAFSHGDGRGAIDCATYRVATALQAPRQHFPTDFIILHQKNPGHCSGKSVIMYQIKPQMVRATSGTLISIRMRAGMIRSPTSHRETSG
jgi:hypothetical protein